MKGISISLFAILLFIVIVYSVWMALSHTNYRVRDIHTSASMVVNGEKGLEVGDTVWVKHGDIVEINAINNEDPWVRPCIIK
jgi:hypothetical protein